MSKPTTRICTRLERQVQKYKQKLQDHHRGNKITDHIVAE